MVVETKGSIRSYEECGSKLLMKMGILIWCGLFANTKVFKETSQTVLVIFLIWMKTIWLQIKISYKLAYLCTWSDTPHNIFYLLCLFSWICAKIYNLLKSLLHQLKLFFFANPNRIKMWTRLGGKLIPLEMLLSNWPIMINQILHEIKKIWHVQLYLL